MKKLTLSLLIFILFVPEAFCQTNWYSQNTGTSSILQDVFFVDQDYGWIAGAQTILHSTDGGNTWVEQPAPPVSLFYVSIYFTDRMNGWACGNDAKIIHTTDGGNTWVSQSNPYVTFNPILYGIYFANPDTGWAVGGDHGSYPGFINRRVILHTTNGGSTWEFQFDQSGEWPFYCVNFSSGFDGYAAGQFGDIVGTSDGGSTWNEKTPVTSYQPYGIYFVNSDTGWTSGEYLGVPHVSYISKTTDGGTSWDIQTFGTDDYLQDIYFIDNQSGWAVGGTIGGSGGTQHSVILHTIDSGANWEPETAPTSSTLLGLSFSPGHTGWAVGSDGVLISTLDPVPVELTSFTASTKENDVTLSWQTTTETNNSGFEIRRSAAGVQSEEPWLRIGYVEGQGTSTRTTDYSFIDKNLKSGNYWYKLIQIDFDGTKTESGVINVKVSDPVKYELAQNYPNPFNPSTSIEYSIPVDGFVSIIIYNSLGEKIRSLVNTQRQAGNYRVNFDADGLSSGIYYYRINAGKYSSVKKMILLR